MKEGLGEDLRARPQRASQHVNALMCAEESSRTGERVEQVCKALVRGLEAELERRKRVANEMSEYIMVGPT